MANSNLSIKNPETGKPVLHAALIGFKESEVSGIISCLSQLNCVCHQWSEKVDFEVIVQTDEPPTLFLINWQGFQLNSPKIVEQIISSSIIPYSYIIAAVDESDPEVIGNILYQNIHDVISFDTSTLIMNARLSVACRILLAEKKLYLQAMKDELTGLYNRRFFLTELACDFQRSTENGSHFCLIYADIDLFKSVNDQHGHVAGDHVLKHISHLMKGMLRTSDTLSRIGGEEFSMICRETDSQNCISLCERIQGALNTSPFIYQGKEIRVTLSFGISEFDSSCETAEELLAQADQQLYQAKQSGRDQIRSRK